MCEVGHGNSDLWGNKSHDLVELMLSMLSVFCFRPFLSFPRAVCVVELTTTYI